MQQNTIEEVLNRIIDSSPVPLFAIDRQHKITHWNDSLEMITGIKKTETIGTDEQWRPFYIRKRPTLADFIVDGDSEEEIEIFYPGKFEKSQFITGAYEVDDFFPEVGEKGKWLHIIACPVKKDNGEIIGAIEILQDITEKTAALEAMSESEKKFRDLFESAIDAIWVHDMDGNILEANQTAAELTGYSLQQLSGANVSQFFPPDSLNLAREVQSKLLNNQTVAMPYEQKIIKNGGKELIVQISTRLITRNYKQVGFQNIARDVTREREMQESVHFYLHKVLVTQEEERKRIARELHDDTAQSLLLLIHRLDAIISQYQDKLYKPAQKKLNDLYKLAVEIIDGIKRYAQELRPPILDDMGLIAVLEWMSDNLRNENGINVEIQSDIPDKLTPDTQLVLFRIAQEALTNVKKHSGASSVIIQLHSDKEKLSMTISDNGCGFEIPAVLGDPSDSRRLGLIGMQERVQLLNGTMNIQSVPGQGTRITVEIPLEK